MNRRTPFWLLLLLLIPAGAVACLWDFDTLEMERRRFPSTLKLITGKFLRHSKEFYECRINDRKQRIESGESDPSLYDDLAVSYEKTGQTELAIETALKTEELFPDRYETAANLGTFYIHSKQFEKGIELIGRALEINPDAHFGREEYQKLLVEYVMEKQQDGTLPLPMDQTDDGWWLSHGLGSWLLKRRGIEPHGDDAEERRGEFEKAIKGVQGMMHFGSYQSPVLLEALGDLLFSNSGEHNALQLSARAYLAASYSVDSPEAKAAYRRKAKSVLAMQLENPARRNHKAMPLEVVEQQFQVELEDATRWYAQLEADERSWIAQGLNPEIEFSKKYRSEPSPVVSPALQVRSDRSRWFGMIVSVAEVACLVIVVAGVLFYFRTRKRSGSNLGPRT